MKTVETQIRSMDDLIFENRNHEYGAYAVRKAYAGNVNRATAVTFGLAAAIAAFSFVRQEQSTTSNDPVPERPVTLEHIIVPPLKLPETARSSSPAQARGSLPPVATSDPVEAIEPVETVTHQAGTDTGEEGVFIDGPVEGTVITAPEPIAPVVDDKIWTNTEVPAQYKGGMEALARFVSRNMRYPSVPRRMGIEGTVFVSFVVGKEGEILEAIVIKGIDAACDAEAVRVINLMKNWSPGVQGGSPVKVRMVLPITFKIQ